MTYMLVNLFLLPSFFLQILLLFDPRKDDAFGEKLLREPVENERRDQRDDRARHHERIGRDADRRDALQDELQRAQIGRRSDVEERAQIVVVHSVEGKDQLRDEDGHGERERDPDKDPPPAHAVEQRRLLQLLGKA